MKKTYIIPEMEVVKIQMQQMLAASPTEAIEEVGGGTQLGREFGDEFDFGE
jgi:hypothetical protein